MALLQKGASGKVLYAICWQFVHRGQILKSETDYIHAEDAVDARLQFLAGKPYSWKYSILGCGPAIGVITEDDHGDRLIV